MPDPAPPQPLCPYCGQPLPGVRGMHLENGMIMTVAGCCNKVLGVCFPPLIAQQQPRSGIVLPDGGVPPGLLKAH